MNVLSLIEIETELHHTVLRRYETHRQDNQVSRPLLLRARDGGHTCGYTRAAGQRGGQRGGVRVEGSVVRGQG